MLFKSLRSKSSSKSTTQQSLRVTSSDSHNTRNSLDQKQPSAIVTPMSSSKPTKEMDDYEKFLEKARKEAEKAEKKKEKEIKEAERRRREVNMSPWAGRM
jgi:flagellar biosynthesis/type III secretory pathway protein FliH